MHYFMQKFQQPNMLTYKGNKVETALPKTDTLLL